MAMLLLYQELMNCHEEKVASFPGLSHFYLLFAFTIIHGSRRLAKNGEGLGAFIT